MAFENLAFSQSPSDSPGMDDGEWGALGKRRRRPGWYHGLKALVAVTILLATAFLVALIEHGTEWHGRVSRHNYVSNVSVWSAAGLNGADGYEGTTRLVDSVDLDCNEVHNVNKSMQCDFVLNTSDCRFDAGFANYTDLVYCFDLPEGVSVTFLIIFLILFFIILGSTADEFFCPSLAVISHTLKLSQNVAGVTFLAFGNGAPDIFSAIAAIGTGDGDPGLALGALFGAGIFVTTVVAGSITLIRPFQMMQRPFLRDTIFYTVAAYWAFVIMYNRVMTLGHSAGFIGMYVAYVAFVILSKYVQDKLTVDPELESKLVRSLSVASIVSRITDIDETPVGRYLPRGSIIKSPEQLDVAPPRKQRAVKDLARIAEAIIVGITLTEDISANPRILARPSVVSLEMRTLNRASTIESLNASLYNDTNDEEEDGDKEEQKEETKNQDENENDIPVFTIEAEYAGHTPTAERRQNKGLKVKRQSVSFDIDDGSAPVSPSTDTDPVDASTPVPAGYDNTAPLRSIRKNSHISNGSISSVSDTGLTRRVSLPGFTSRTELASWRTRMAEDEESETSSTDGGGCCEGGFKANAMAWLQELWRGLNPINMEEFKSERIHGKIYDIIRWPLMFLLKVTVPVVDLYEEGGNWCKPLNTVHCITGPMLIILMADENLRNLAININGEPVIPVPVLVFIVGLVLAIIVSFTSKPDKPPVYHNAFAYVGFFIAVIWIYTAANNVVNLLLSLGFVFNISDEILGLTFLAWGNSIGDFIANTVMAKQGFPRMGISACFGGPLLNLLLGIGIPFTLLTAQSGDYPFAENRINYILAGSLAVSLISSLVIIPCRQFQMTRPYGIYLIVLYVAFLAVAITSETGLY